MLSISAIAIVTWSSESASTVIDEIEVGPEQSVVMADSRAAR